MLRPVAAVLTRWSLRWVPDAWIIAVLLTVLTLGLGLAFTSRGLYGLIRDWGDGFWSLHSFGMQMCLIVITGSILADARPVRAFLNGLAGLPRSPRQAVALMAFVSMLLAWFHWGLSLIGSAVLARAMARRQRGVDYGLLVCTAYLGLGGVWHAGLSASAPLLVATPQHFMEAEMGRVPVTETIFRPFHLGLTLLVVVVWTVLAALLHPRPEDTVEADPALLAEVTPEAVTPRRPTTPAEWMAHTPWVNLLVAGAGFAWLATYFRSRGLAGLTIDTVNFGFLMLGILLRGTPAAFLRSAAEASRHVWGIILQFPFYGGIFGIMKSSGLAEVIAGWFSAIATPQTYPLIVYWYSGILNYFVPSGGSKWIIEAPYIVRAARQLGVGMPETVLAYAWGDMMTDVIQPFWAIPLLSIARLEFRHILGYAIVFFIVYVVLTSAAFFLWPRWGA
jgi:short-chain fatty acids transporter